MAPNAKDANWLLNGTNRWLLWQLVTTRGFDGFRDEIITWKDGIRLHIVKETHQIHLIYMLGHKTVMAEFDLKTLQMTFQAREVSLADSAMIHALTTLYVTNKL